MGLATLLHGLIPRLLKTFPPIQVSQPSQASACTCTRLIAPMTSPVSAAEDHGLTGDRVQVPKAALMATFII